jgi:MYND finger
MHMLKVVVPTFSALKLDINDRAFNPFAVMRNVSSINPWSVHRVNLSRLPILDTAGRGNLVLYGWLNPHIGSTFSQREVSIRKKGGRDALLLIKDTIHSIFARSSGIQGDFVRRVYALRDKATMECDTIFFISNLRFDLPTHGMVCDGFFLPLTPDLMNKIKGVFGNLVKDGNIFNMTMFEEERIGWKQILPMMVERCRSTWQHTANCEYKSTGRIPKTDVLHEDPICSCGRGKDVEGMRQVSLWKSLAPYVTRIALSPLFVVSYLESVGRDPASRRCFVCRGKGQPNLKECSTCCKVRYCSKDCQKKNWDAHRVRCKPHRP